MVSSSLFTFIKKTKIISNSYCHIFTGNFVIKDNIPPTQIGGLLLGILVQPMCLHEGEEPTLINHLPTD
jgi:hypothetical protein